MRPRQYVRSQAQSVGRELGQEFLASEKFEEPEERQTDNGLQEVLSRKAELMSAFAKGELFAETVFPAVQQLQVPAKELRQAQVTRVRQPRSRG